LQVQVLSPLHYTTTGPPAGGTVDEDGEDGPVSEDSSRRRRASDDDEARPVTAAGRRRRASGDGAGEAADTGTSRRPGGKGTTTPTRDRAQAEPEGSLITRLRRFLREVVAELRKVHWPTRRQIVVYTFVVLVFVAFMVSLVAALDWVFAKAVFALFG
jgi:preprotein translocase subunit SecE